MYDQGNHHTVFTSTLILAVTNLLLYSIGTALQLLVWRKQLTHHRRLTLSIGMLALLTHTALSSQLVWRNDQLNLGLTEAFVVVSGIAVALLLALNLRKPLELLFLAIYPFAGLTIIAALALQTPPRYVNDAATGMLAHITLSITAYALFSLAAIQALLVYAQNKQLKQHHNSFFVQNLPPLETMESLLFELVWGGLVLLTLAIISGALFIENLFAQHLAHKTVFSLLSWMVFAGLLIGRHLKGWRGATASRWTLSGCLLLTLGYFGSKFVLEFLFRY